MRNDMRSGEYDERMIGKCVLVPKDELLVRLKKNREDHRGKFVAALDGWKTQVVEALTEACAKAVEEAKAGVNYRTYIRLSLPQPEDHTRDYDDVIEAVEWQNTDTILLTREDFTRYVRDVWDWTSAFNESVSSYTVH